MLRLIFGRFDLWPAPIPTFFRNRPWLEAVCFSLLILILAGTVAPSPLLAAPEGDRLLNLSSQAWVGDGSDVLIAGFAISAGPDKDVLIRAIGPTLGGFGVNGTLVNPTLEIVDSQHNLIASNERWSPDLASTFDTLGAFEPNAGSNDAALIARLAPGTYTALVRTAPGTAYGTALVEVYDVSGPARLTNLSTRARVESNQTLIISGLVIAPGSGNRRVLLRAVGPSLREHGVPDAMDDPVIALVRREGQVQIAVNDDWGSNGGVSVLAATFNAAGAFPLIEGSKDAALVANLEPGVYTLMVSGVNGSAGPALVEVYDLTDVAPTTIVGATATRASTDTLAGTPPGAVRISRTGDNAEDLVVNLSVDGSAVSGTDFVRLPASIIIPAGQSFADLDVVPYPNNEVTSFSRKVRVSVAPGGGYIADPAHAAEVTLFFETGSLYFANLAPQSPNSAAYGTAALKLASDNSSLTINARFANLSSPVTAAYLRLGEPGQSGTLLVRLPASPTANTQWDIAATGPYSAEDIVTALRQGRIFVTVDTANHPTGELSGTALRYDASATFVPPAPPSAAPTAPASTAEAARFLTQATFGPTRTSINQLMGQTYAEWIDAQIAAPSSSHLQIARALSNVDPIEHPDLPTGGIVRSTRMDAWWTVALQHNDQLRQRVAFALSQILVISDRESVILDNHGEVARYYDILARHAFGSYRELLEEVTLDPLMGQYLSHVQNSKANPAIGLVPDENFAREIMQLFTIGLVELHPDGTLKLDGNGLPVSSYDQTTITETARVFTGWGFNNPGATEADFFLSKRRYDRPMLLYPSYHDDGAKTIVTGRVLPAGQGAVRDLDDTLDTLVGHPNTGPFIARRLIQRLVTSNPTPGYIFRVARVFADNGAGQRGDLGAVVKAILLDPEARSATAAAQPTFGKVKEPLLRISALLRAFNAQLVNDRLNFIDGDPDIAQAPVSARSVFNFFRPDYVPVGDLAASGLVAPELQITTDTTAINVPNQLSIYAFANSLEPAERVAQRLPRLNIDHLTALWGQPGRIVDELNLLLCAGSLSADSRARLLTAAESMSGKVDAVGGVTSLIYLVATSPDAAVQN